MIASIFMYDINKVREPSYVHLCLIYNLTERQICDIFKTDWLELKKQDQEDYENIYSEYQYMKLYLDSELIYSGSVLDSNELQSKLKHNTRVDCRLDN